MQLLSSGRSRTSFRHSHAPQGMQAPAPCRAHPSCRRSLLPLASAATEPDVAPLVQRWLQWDRRGASRQRVTQLLEDGSSAQLRELLGSRLEFGTAGLRGKMGPGTARMNAVVVQQTAQGLCVYLEAVAAEQLAAGGIVVGYDGRHGSKEFAALTGAVFASRGHRVALFRRVVPTPFVAAGVAELGAAAGVMVTASHNPKEYNGYKVYWGNGCQIIPPHDAGIAAAIEANLDLWNLEPLLAGDGPYEDDVSTAGLLACPQLSDPWERVSAAYYARLAALSYLPAAEAAETAEAASSRSGASNSGGAGGLSRAAALSALGTPVYTPLHGVGAEPLLQAFKTFSLPEPYIVPSQRLPDPDFPTVVFPNPEEGAGTWAAAFAAASERGARLVLANDPDADRLAVAERSPTGQFRPFTGNEIGALLAHWVWTNFRKRHPEVAPSRCVMLASAVSSKLLGAMAEREGFVFVETLTGFKWLGNTATRLEREQGMTVLFAFEEAIGFMLGGMYKDKDGISAASVFAELAAHTYGSGRTLDELLRGLYDRYGFFDYRSGYFITDAAKSRAVFNDLRGGGGFGGRTAVYAKNVAGVGVTSVRDLGTGLDTAQPDGRAVLPWQSGDMMITYGLEGGATLTLRASGTEPKLKYYLEVKGSDAAAAAALADRLVGGLAEELVGLSRHGLKRPATPH